LTIGCTEEGTGVDTTLVGVLGTLGILGVLGALGILGVLGALGIRVVVGALGVVGTLGVTILIVVGTVSVGILDDKIIGVVDTVELIHFPFERTCPSKQVRHPIPPSLYVKA